MARRGAAAGLAVRRGGGPSRRLRGDGVWGNRVRTGSGVVLWPLRVASPTEPWGCGWRRPAQGACQLRHGGTAGVAVSGYIQ